MLSATRRHSVYFFSGRALLASPCPTLLISTALVTNNNMGNLLYSQSKPACSARFVSIQRNLKNGNGLTLLDALPPQGIALLAARSTRLPIYTAFAKHGNVGDLYAKGEALSVLSNVAGMWLGIQLASGVCGSVQGKVRSTGRAGAMRIDPENAI